MTGSKSLDKPFLFITIALVLIGLFILSSASMGLLTKDGPNYSSILGGQILFGVTFGAIALYVSSIIKYSFWKKYSFHFLVTAIILNLCVFVPYIGLSHGGATRWINFFGYSFQPSEALKITFVIFYSAWLGAPKQSVATFKRGFIPLSVFFATIGIVLLLQKDTDTIGVIVVSGILMFFCAGGKIRHIAILIFSGFLVLTCIIALRPYVLDRILTFIDPSRDPLGAGYQINQSLIAVGSGEISGRGFGQSLQKFNYLPEPIGDSIFAVAAEEFGFIGSFVIILLFIIYALRGIKIAKNAPDIFSSSLVVGIVSLITVQSFLNISAMIGILPLSGTPLLFISHGGTALLFALAETGIVLNISRFAGKK